MEAKMNNNKQNNDNFRKNQELDEFIMKTKIIPIELQRSFLEAYNYGSATPYNWLINKLRIIKGRLEKNEEIKLEGGKLNLDNSSFKEWVIKEFTFTENDLF